jgi:hypothetical protein
LNGIGENYLRIVGVLRAKNVSISQPRRN